MPDKTEMPEYMQPINTIKLPPGNYEINGEMQSVNHWFVVHVNPTVFDCEDAADQAAIS